jgi:hypothetical protein
VEWLLLFARSLRIGILAYQFISLFLSVRLIALALPSIFPCSLTHAVNLQFFPSVLQNIRRSKVTHTLSHFSLVLRAVLVTREVAIAWVVAGQTLVILALTWAAFDTIMGHLTRLKMLNSLDAHDLQVP